MLSVKYESEIRHIFLEDAFKIPKLRMADMNDLTLTDLKNFKIPLLDEQIDDSLSTELSHTIPGGSIRQTDWSEYSDPLCDQSNITRFLHFTLSIYSNRIDRGVLGPLPPPLPRNGRNHKKELQRENNMKLQAEAARQNHEFLKQECERLGIELVNGERTRWKNFMAHLASPEGGSSNLKELHVKTLKSAIEALSKNPSMHPNVKGEVLGNMVSTLKSSKV